uniref:Uncharacterized protein n=1 Tax=Glossina austeni TaxID=7395 RepID=A0A1A9UPP0_GLOAU
MILDKRIKKNELKENNSVSLPKTDRSKNVVKAKAKNGSVVLQPDSTLALLRTKTSKAYKIPSCVQHGLNNAGLDKRPRATIIPSALVCSCKSHASCQVRTPPLATRGLLSKPQP